MSIPKIIHIVWFNRKGKTPTLPYQIQHCKETIQKYAIDKGYELHLWNENTFNVNSFDWTKEAYEVNGWALGFLVDLIKFWSLYNYGGIYLDADYELQRPLDDLLNCSVFFGKENPGHKVGTAIIGAEKGNLIIKHCFEFYRTQHFFKNPAARFNWNSIYCVADRLSELGIHVEDAQKDEKSLLYDSELVGNDDLSIILYSNQKLYNSGYYAASPISPNGYGRHINIGSWGNENY